MTVKKFRIKDLPCYLLPAYFIYFLSIPIALRPSLKDSPCQECQDLKNLSVELLQNFSLLAETGYAEGVMCHTLVKEGDTARYVQPSPNPTFAMRLL